MCGKCFFGLLQAKQYAASLAQGDITLKEYKKVADYSFGDIIKSILLNDREGTQNE